MAIHLRERPHTSAGAPNYSRLGWGVATLALCLVGLGGGARLLMEPAAKPSVRMAEQTARKSMRPTPAPSARTAAAAAPSSQTRSVRVIPTDRTPVASIAAASSIDEPVEARPSLRAFADVQRASGAAYQGFRTVAGR